MARGKELSPQMRSRICELHSLHYSYARIHRVHPEIPLSTIGYMCRMERKRQDNVSCKRPGAPRVITEEQRDMMFEAIQVDPTLTYEALRAQECPNASVRSAPRMMQEMNIRKWIRLKRPGLQPEHAAQRLEWARTHEHYTYLNWRRVRWSDEVSIALRRGDKFGWVFIPSGQGQRDRRLHPDLIQPKICGKGKSKMFWAVFGWHIKTELVTMEGDPLSARGGVTARVYMDILERHLRPIMGFHSIFMHDNASIHTARIIKAWLLENGVNIMRWPPYSPD